MIHFTYKGIKSYSKWGDSTHNVPAHHCDGEVVSETDIISVVRVIIYHGTRAAVTTASFFCIFK